MRTARTNPETGQPGREYRHFDGESYELHNDYLLRNRSSANQIRDYLIKKGYLVRVVGLRGGYNIYKRTKR